MTSNRSRIKRGRLTIALDVLKSRQFSFCIRNMARALHRLHRLRFLLRIRNGSKIRPFFEELLSLPVCKSGFPILFTVLCVLFPQENLRAQTMCTTAYIHTNREAQKLEV